MGINSLIADSAIGAAIGTVIMPGVGTAAGAAVGGLVGLFTGGPEAQQHAANVGGRTIDARQIYEQIKNGPGTGSLQTGSQAANVLKSTHEDRAAQIEALNREMDAAWQGDAAQAAQAGGHPLTIWLNDSADNLANCHRFIDNQISDFDTVSAKVQPLPEEPPSMGITDHINPWSDKDAEIEAYNRKGQQNVDAFNAYYQASMQNAAGMPQFQEWSGNNISEGKIETSIETKPYPKGGPDDGGGKSRIDNGINIGDRTGGGDSTSSSKKLPFPTNPDEGGIGGPGRGGGGSWDPPSVPPPVPPRTDEYWPQFVDDTTAAGYADPTLGGGGGGFGPGGGGGGGLGGGGFGPGGAGSGIGVGGVAGIGSGGAAGLGAGASTGAGAGSGSGAGMGAAGGAARGGAAGAAGRPGATGMAGMGGHGARGKGEEDEEHQTKYLVSEDPNELFGTDELTAPPVIGE